LDSGIKTHIKEVEHIIVLSQKFSIEVWYMLTLFDDIGFCPLIIYCYFITGRKIRDMFEYLCL
jgi:hypothetical protein